MRVWQEGKGHVGLRAAGVRAAGLSGGTGKPAWSLQNPSEPLRTSRGGLRPGAKLFFL